MHDLKQYQEVSRCVVCDPIQNILIGGNNELYDQKNPCGRISSFG